MAEGIFEKSRSEAGAMDEAFLRLETMNGKRCTLFAELAMDKRLLDNDVLATPAMIVTKDTEAKAKISTANRKQFRFVVK